MAALQDITANMFNASSPAESTSQPHTSAPTTTSHSANADTAFRSLRTDLERLPKKEEDENLSFKPKSPGTKRPSASHIAPIAGFRSHSPLRSSEGLAGAGSPNRHPYHSIPISPGMAGRSGSPKPPSPASSMIFERNVQEEVVPAELSPAIPAHMITENHIPPALDASTEAITNKKLNPDEVEIITSSMHQPAAMAIPHSLQGAGEHSLSSSIHDDMSHAAALAHLHRHDADNASNYASLDNTDVRRLSFISFADVVHGEQEMEHQQRRDSAAHTGGAALPTSPPLTAGYSLPRSPSPMRSPVSSQAFGTSPPTSVSASGRGGHEVSPSRGVRSAGSPLPGQSSPLANAPSSELNIETMTQALHKTRSTDLSGFRSAAQLSNVPTEDTVQDRHHR